MLYAVARECQEEFGAGKQVNSSHFKVAPIQLQSLQGALCEHHPPPKQLLAELSKPR